MSGFKQVGGGWDQAQKMANKSAMGLKLNTAISKALRGVGGYLVDNLQRNIHSRGTLLGQPFVPNAEYTVIKKGHDKPLIHTGGLGSSIKLHSTGDIEYFVGIRDDPYMERGKFLESGGVTTIEGATVFVPARPFMQPILHHAGIRTVAHSMFVASMNSSTKIIFGG